MNVVSRRTMIEQYEAETRTAAVMGYAVSIIIALCWCPKLYKQYGNSHYHKTRICNDSKYRNDKTTTTENAHV